jgi:release factor glutamine methyltransferase
MNGMSGTDWVVARLEAAGCVAAVEEAGMLRERAGRDDHVLEAMLRRREGGEPVEWIVEWAPFCGLRVCVRAGVYVPRAQTELLARRAATCLPSGGVAVDLATGSGAIAMVVQAAQPTATVVATELDPVACKCAKANGVDVLRGDLDAPLPESLAGTVDVMTANVPYVPAASLRLLPRDVQQHEPRLALDGGADGLDLVRRVLALAPRWLRPRSGRVLVEIGPDQAREFGDLEVLYDDDGEVRAIVAGPYWPG